MIDGTWTDFINSLNVSDCLLFCGVFLAVKLLVINGGQVLFAHAHEKGWWSKYRMAPGKSPRPALMKEAIIANLKDDALSLIFLPLIVYPLFVASGLRFEGAPDPLWIIAGQVVAFFIINDTIFYWSHRLLHTPTLFKKIHFLHHKFRYVQPISVQYAHPIENGFALLAFFAGPLIFDTHFVTLAIWMLFRFVETMDAHSGYAFPFSPSGERHAFHHMAIHSNFGSLWSPWDRLLKTDLPYREWVEGGREGEPKPIKLKS